jgi:autotransporter-associated beta strand protein
MNTNLNFLNNPYRFHCAQQRPLDHRICSRLSRLTTVLASLATAFLLAPSASAQQTLYTTTTSNTTWVGATGRWSTSGTGPFTSTWTDYSTANIVNSGTYNFQRLIATGTANIGNVTLGSNVRVIFAQSSGQAMNFLTGTGGVATFDIGTGSQVDFGSIIIAPSANSGYTKNGAGSLTMTGGIIQGPVTLNAGNLVARNSNAFGQGALTINGGTLGATTNMASPTNRQGGLIVTNDFQIGISGSAGNASSTANMTFSGTGNSVSLGSSRRTITLGNSGSMTFGGAIAGSGGLTLTRNADGAGWFALSGTNTFTGGLTLDGVRVNASASDTALGGSGVYLGGTTGYDTTLNLTSAVTLGNTISFANTAGVKTLANIGASATISGTVNNNDSTGTQQIGAGSGRTFTLAGGLSGTGSANWTFGGTSGATSLVGTVVIGAASSYSGTGNTTINNSTVKLGAGEALASNDLNLSGTATLDLAGYGQTLNKLTGDSGSKIQSTGGSQGLLKVGDGDTSSIFDGSILGTGGNVALEKIGQGSLTLTNTGNTFSGGVTVANGDLFVSTAALANQAVALSSSNSRITFNQGSSGTFAGDISGAGMLNKTGAGAVTLGGNNSYSGDTTLTDGTLALGSANAIGSSGTISFGGGTLQSSASNTTDYSARFSNAASQQYKIDTNGQNVTLASNLTSSGGSFTKIGTGTATLSGNNSYSGDTTLTDGTLALGSANAIGSSGTISFGGGTLQSSASNTTDYSARFSNAANQSYRVDTNGQNVTLASALTSSGGSFTKLGAGSVILGGNNSYSGSTIIDNGDLKVNGSIANSAVTINSNGSLSGSGTVGGISGAGSINPGNSPGILTAPWIDPSDGMFLNFEITGIKPEYSLASGSVNDVLRLTSGSPFVAAMNSGNQINVYFNMASFDMTQAYRAGIYTDEQADFTSMVSGASFNYYVQDNAGTINYNGVLYSALSSAVTVSTVLDTANFAGGTVNGRVMQFTIVPETSSALLAACGALFLLRRRRKA